MSCKQDILLQFFVTISKSDLCLSLHTGRPESAQASHVDGDNCHCHIWNHNHKHNLDLFTPVTISELAYDVIHMLLLFNSAVNPFVYALVNKNFREKLKGMICCS